MSQNLHYYKNVIKIKKIFFHFLTFGYKKILNFLSKKRKESQIFINCNLELNFYKIDVYRF